MLLPACNPHRESLKAIVDGVPVGVSCMYRYHRPSRNVKGKIIYVSTQSDTVLVQWDDGGKSVHSIHSVELIV